MNMRQIPFIRKCHILFLSLVSLSLSLFFFFHFTFICLSSYFLSLDDVTQNSLMSLTLWVGFFVVFFFFFLLNSVFGVFPTPFSRIVKWDLKIFDLLCLVNGIVPPPCWAFCLKSVKGTQIEFYFLEDVWKIKMAVEMNCFVLSAQSWGFKFVI